MNRFKKRDVKNNKFLIRKKVAEFFLKDEIFSFVDSVFLILFLALVIKVAPKHPEILRWVFLLILLQGVFYIIWLGSRLFKKDKTWKMWRIYLSLSLITSVIILGLVSLLLLK